MKVLCVAPRFAPLNAADSHRLRLLVPHLLALGHDVEVLAVDPCDVPMPQDEWLATRLPPQLRVHRARVPARSWGMRSLEHRAWRPLARAGDKLLAGGGFDLVFFSTTDFLLHALGPRWHARWDVPFCMDYQDPWVNDYYSRHPEVVPPGGRLKYAVKSRWDRVAERRVVRECAGFLAVSPAYLRDLEQRYGDAVRGKPQQVAGFPGEPAEFEGMPSPQRGGPRVWRYIGRGGADMQPAARGFFRAWRRAVDENLDTARTLRFEAIGTSYAEDGGQTLAPCAAAEGLAARVSEQPRRIGYRAMLEALATSDALVVFGSDDPAYTGSKLYPYLLSGRPVLAILHAASPAVPLLLSVGGAVLVTFDADTSADALAARILQAWFAPAEGPRAPPLDRQAFEPFTARAQAQLVAGWWQDILDQARPHAG